MEKGKDLSLDVQPADTDGHSKPHQAAPEEAAQAFLRVAQTEPDARGPMIFSFFFSA